MASATDRNPNSAGLGAFSTLWANVWEERVRRWTSAHLVSLSELNFAGADVDFCKRGCA